MLLIQPPVMDIMANLTKKLQFGGVGAMCEGEKARSLVIGSWRNSAQHTFYVSASIPSASFLMFE